MKHQESFEIISRNGELFFKDNVTGKLFDLISRFELQPIAGQSNQHYVRFKVFRLEELYDFGEESYINRDDESFVSQKIFQEYWKAENNIRNCSDYFFPEMFKEGDLLEIEHNSRDTISEKIKKYKPSFVEFEKENHELSMEELYKKYDQIAEEIFPEVYRYRKPKE